MIFHPTPLNGLFLIEPEPFQDNRGLFTRIFCTQELQTIGFSGRIDQVNRSVTKKMGTIRGMHYQQPPKSEIKIVSCLRGKVFDVAIDLRAGSSTLFKWFGVRLTENNMKALYIPEGFAHGFQTLAPDSELLYFHSRAYSPSHEAAVRWDDPSINIDWPLIPEEISEKDKKHPLLNDSFTGIVL